MRQLPVFLDIRGRAAVVVGGGAAAAAKARLLTSAGAEVAVVAAAPDAELVALAGAGEVSLRRRAFEAADVAGAAVVVSATGDEDEDARVAAAARAAGIPVNVVDTPALSSFTMPAIVDRDPITVAISSGGAAPALSRTVRARIEALLPPETGRLARFAESFRAAVKATLADGRARRRFWDRFYAGPIADAVLAGDETVARERMLAAVNRQSEGDEPGIVHLVGAGPGDPDLLTVKATRLLQEADAVVHDRLVGPGILDRARREARRIDVGKAKGEHRYDQEAIDALLVALAREGLRVVRLKGGDPFVFGRGGEEVEALRRAGVAVEVVPGITAATGCAAAAGIPLTHRDLAHAAAFVTGHGKDGEPDVDWAALARGGQTVVVYMGASAAGRIAERLIAEGLGASTPAAVIENGTRRDQRIAAGPLSALAALAAGSRGGAPVLIVVGEVVRLSAAWREAAEPRRAAAG